MLTEILSVPTLPKESHGLPQLQEFRSITQQAKAVIMSDLDELPPGDLDSDEEGSSDEDESAQWDSHNLCKDIAFASECLTELRPSLEQNLVNAEKAHTQPEILPAVSSLITGPARAYVKLVKEKYPKVGDQLADRLGEANWQRHQNVRNQKEVVTVPIEEEAGSTFQPISVFHDSGIGTSVPAQAHYAPSHTSFVSSDAAEDEGSLRVPALPAEAGLGKSFQCFICRQKLSNIRNRIDWKYAGSCLHLCA